MLFVLQTGTITKISILIISFLFPKHDLVLDEMLLLLLMSSQLINPMSKSVFKTKA